MSTATPITVEALEKRVRELAKLHRGRTAENHYFDPDTKAGVCIIGTALIDLGYEVPDRFFDSTPNQINALFNDALISDLPADLGVPCSDWLRRAQGAQDDGSPWGEAADYADEVPSR